MSDTETPILDVTDLTTSALFARLAENMARADAAIDEMDRIQRSIADELAIPKMDRQDALAAIAAIRSEIKDRMTADGALRMEHAGLQVIRPKTKAWVITDLDHALAHLADLDRLHDVQTLVTDEKKVVEIAKLMHGDARSDDLEGVEEQVSFGFTVKRMGA